MAGTPSALSSVSAVCEVCVAELDVDGAAVSMVLNGVSWGTLGHSGEGSVRLEDVQFTLGEGPSLAAVETDSEVLVADLAGDGQRRWPAFSEAALHDGVGSVFAFPVRGFDTAVAALDVFRYRAGGLSEVDLAAGKCAAELVSRPVMRVISAEVDAVGSGDSFDGASELASVQRVEVYQATGMLIAALGIDPAEALVRLRAYAFARGLTASEVAWALTQRQLMAGALAVPWDGEERS